MRNQPKYSLFDNARYAFEGLWEVFWQESSFKIEAILSLIVWIVLLFIDIPFWAKCTLGLSPLIILIVEVANSAIERVVDLVTQEYHPLAKKAKDAGAAMVLLSVVFTILIWSATIWTLLTNR